MGECMKKINIIFFSILVGSSVATAVASQKKERSWYQKFHIADYLPNAIGSRITQWRVKRMFGGTEKFIQRLLKESKTWKEKDAQAFVTEYRDWIDQFYDIINTRYSVEMLSGNVGAQVTVADQWSLAVVDVDLEVLLNTMLSKCFKEIFLILIDLGAMPGALLRYNFSK